jgi:hypothetical protein
MYSKGISWIDDCRIPFVDDGDKGVFNKNSEGINRQKNSNVMETYMNNSFIIGNHKIDDTRQQGRFPANLLVSDDMLNDGVISKSVSGGKGKPIPRQDRMAEETITERGGFNDKGTNSRYYDIDKWFDKIIE